LYGDPPLAGAEGDERIMHVDATEIKLVRAGCRVGEQKRRKDYGSHVEIESRVVGH